MALNDQSRARSTVSSFDSIFSGFILKRNQVMIIGIAIFNSWKFLRFLVFFIVFWFSLAFSSLYLLFEIWYYENHEKTRKKANFEKRRKNTWQDCEKPIKCQKTTKKTIFAKIVQTFSPQSFFMKWNSDGKSRYDGWITQKNDDIQRRRKARVQICFCLLIKSMPAKGCHILL